MLARAFSLRETLRKPKAMVMQSKCRSGTAGVRRPPAHNPHFRRPRVHQPATAVFQHCLVDVGKHHAAGFAHLAGQPARQIAGAAGHVQRCLARLQAGLA